MGKFDNSISVFFNSFAHRSWALDRIVNFLGSNGIVKGSLVLAVFFLVWFQLEEPNNGREMSAKRQTLLYTLILCPPAVLLARLLASILPFRVRPMHNPDLHLHMAYGFDPGTVLNWSSFPSDHTVLFFALATGVFLVSRKVGFLLYAHAVLIISLPRLYLGIHYPSDLLAGAVLGTALACSVKWSALRSLVTQPALRLYQTSRPIFYAGFFFLGMQTAEMYDAMRTAAGGAGQVLHPLLRQMFGLQPISMEAGIVILMAMIAALLIWSLLRKQSPSYASSGHISKH